MSNDEKLGYLTKAVEDLSRSMQMHMEREEEDRGELRERLRNIEKDISLVKLIIKILKVSFWTVVFLLTIRFGDIKTLWSSIHLH